MRHLILLVSLIACLSCFFSIRQPLAQSTPDQPAAVTIDKRKLLVQPRNAANVSPWSEPVLWVRQKQESLYAAMSGALRRMKSEQPLAAALSLMALSFGYGVFHAAGPGHGKAVISAWLLATENELRRGVLVAFLGSALQAVTAIAVVSGVLLLVAGAGSAARQAAGVLESASFALIAGLGLYLIWTAFRPRRHAAAGAQSLHHHHDHQHTDECGCGHMHLPGAAEVKENPSWTKMASLSLVLGMRPCSGALLVLLFAYAGGLYWAGIASAFAMAVGTFLTVSAFAAIAVFSRRLARRLAASDARWLSWLDVGLRLGAGIAIVGIGGILFLGSLGSAVGSP